MVPFIALDVRHSTWSNWVSRAILDNPMKKLNQLSHFDLSMECVNDVQINMLSSGRIFRFFNFPSCFPIHWLQIFLDLFFRILLTTNKALLILCSTLDVSSTLLILVHVMVAFQRINSTMSGYFALTEHWNLTPNSHHFSCMFSSVVTYSIDFTEGIKITPLRPLQISIYFIFSLILNMFILKIRQHR